MTRDVTPSIDSAPTQLLDALREQRDALLGRIYEILGLTLPEIDRFEVQASPRADLTRDAELWNVQFEYGGPTITVGRADAIYRVDGSAHTELFLHPTWHEERGATRHNGEEEDVRWAVALNVGETADDGFQRLIVGGGFDRARTLQVLGWNGQRYEPVASIDRTGREPYLEKFSAMDVLRVLGSSHTGGAHCDAFESAEADGLIAALVPNRGRLVLIEERDEELEEARVIELDLKEPPENITSGSLRAELGEVYPITSKNSAFAVRLILEFETPTGPGSMTELCLFTNDTGMPVFHERIAFQHGDDRWTAKLETTGPDSSGRAGLELVNAGGEPDRQSFTWQGFVGYRPVSDPS